MSHYELLNKHIKEKSFKIRATSTEHVPAKRTTTAESNEGNEEYKQFRVKNNNEEWKEWIITVKRVSQKVMSDSRKN